MKKYSISILFLIFPLSARPQVTQEYYLPENVTYYNSSVPAPKQFFGHEIGEWHLTHDKLYFYMLELAKASDRAIWEEYGKSYESRPLGQLIISSPENIRKIEQLRQEHAKLCDPMISDNCKIPAMPVFIKLGYGVHGNESSSQNASAIVAYYLTAGEGKVIDRILQNAVILIDPSLNPDGMQRHSTWVNFTRSLNNNPDPASWEFSESWPGGRTNHYWFDLNRDYLMLQHPESQGRVEAFHRWKPNIVTDHHETGANETFFFQPGIQSRNNPLTPKENSVLTAEIGKYHTKYLDSIGSLYFTEESFDDFYIGKGSSYPDIHGSIGILFEQAGVKGHLRETPNGLLSFPFAIRNHVTVSLSTIEAGIQMKDRLLESQKNFYKEAVIQADKYPVKAFIFSDPEDKSRISEFINILLRHQIKVFRTSREITKEGITYNAGGSYLIPLKQAEYRFIRSLFEPVTEFTDSAFYDVSTWVLPMSFNLNYAALIQTKEIDNLTGNELLAAPEKSGQLIFQESPYAYMFEWTDYLSPRALYTLQKSNIITRVSTESFTYEDENLKKTFPAGTIIVAASGQPVNTGELNDIIAKVASDCGIKVYGVKSGLTKEGFDLGSSHNIVLQKPNIAQVTGNGANSGDAGEIWHLLDSKFQIPVTMLSGSKLGNVDLERYNTIIITGSPEISPSGVEKLKLWNRNGGILIAIESGNSWLADNKFAEIKFVPASTDKRKDGIYVNKLADQQAREIPGSIFRAKLDLTHPLCFGLSRDLLPVFKSSSTVARKDTNIYNNPAQYIENPLLSGYCSKENIERIKGSPFVSVHGNRIISIYDDPNFRAAWYGTNKIFLNAIFFGQILK